jgi:hypothetical protein
MMWLLAGVTTLVLAVIALMIKDISKVPAVARPAALSASVRGTRQATRPPTARPKPSPLARPGAPEVTDSSAGLSYRLLSPPWRRGCPSTLDTPEFSWTAGESAVAGQVLIDGTATAWYGNACSGRLAPEFGYSGPADLQPAADSLADALGAAYYSGLRHYRALKSSSAMLVSGHRAWVVTFLMTYPDATSLGLPWSSEAGAVVVVDRGPGSAPAVFYLSVPSNLGTSAVGTLIGSLELH